ncbi:helix-turn-helix transcriptional regulator [Virgibacillus halodenitrificans]|uniref:helix-turn-helix domain-containing protein n=1 Tax=Virgibacillus halodenitrificans TaxID=1482 RepID=UPI0024BF3E82|nr:helix-turn-helix transcriptional regulator [Virgibacillus halodenitrificans]WHX25110.1 helix-turn-helix transcriptional regulator [Virgibacillus halodenitrificans]
MSIGERLRDAREYLGLSLETVSNKLNIPVKSLNGFESDEQVPDESKMVIIAQLYKHPKGFFLKGEEVFNSNFEVGILARTDAELTEQDKKQLIRFSSVLSLMKEGEK